MDLALAVGLVLVTLPFVVGGSWAQEAAIGAGVLVLLVFIVLYLLARYRERALALFMRMGQRWPVLLRLGGNALPAFFNGLAVLTDGRRFPARQRLDAAQLGHRRLAVLPHHGGLFSQPQPVMGGLQPGRLGAGGGSPFLAGSGGCDGALHRRRAVCVRAGRLRRPGFRPDPACHPVPDDRGDWRVRPLPGWRVPGGHVQPPAQHAGKRARRSG